MLENLTIAVDKLVERHYVANIESTLEELLENWDGFPAADPPRSGDAPVHDQFKDALAELVALRLSTTDAKNSIQR